jgi:HAMP domain-containing protein/signal transduction histidine kinase/DNA-binding response OmpR family regulator
MPADAVNESEILLRALVAVREGDFGARLPVEWTGLSGKIADTFNEVVGRQQAFVADLARLREAVVLGGSLDARVQLNGARDGWNAGAADVNALVEALVRPIRESARVAAAIGGGDLSAVMSVVEGGRPLMGERLAHAEAVNGATARLAAAQGAITRLVREVGIEGRLGGRADIDEAAGAWKELADNANLMSENLAVQLRGIAAISTAVAAGDLSTRIEVPVRGELLELKNTINRQVDLLNAFAREVTRVAREVGTEGKLGGQAKVEGVAGTWKDLTDSVNAMASNLTVQLRDVAKVATAIAKGDLTRKITVDARGEILQIKDTINTTVDQLGAFASEVTRVAREVGTEGKLGGQARVEGVSGTWRDLTDSVNAMAGNLTSQLRDMSKVASSIAGGDLTQKITVDARGEILTIKDTINTMVDQLQAFAAEVTRVAREVGTEGKLGGQARVEGVSGTWKDLTDSVNAMAGNLTVQLRDVSKVATAIASGDLRQKVSVEVRGEILQIKETINTMVDQLSAFASEVTRVAREVGTEGKLGGQARVEGVSGTWKDLTDSVNGLAGNLTVQLRDVSRVATAIAVGDLGQKITVELQGELLQIKDTINTTVDRLRAFAAEVTRVAREVGTEGRLGGQARVEGVAGTWKDLTDSVNALANNLTAQVRDVSRVAGAIASGDLGQKITVEAQGEVLLIKDTINRMVEQLRAFASEVSRVAREVGTEGKLGGQAQVSGVAGVWKELTDNVNALAQNLTSQVRNIAEVTTAVANGDLSRKITVDVRGEVLLLKDTINTMVEQLRGFAAEVTRVAREVGTEGRLGGQAYVPVVAGTWKDLTDNVNFMASNLTGQVRNIASVTTAVAYGDLSKKITVDARGEILELKNTVNTMVDQLNAFAAEVTRVAREVGTEGRLGGQAQVRGVAGTWRDLTDNVNQMAGNLTDQVRGIARVVTAVATGNLKQKLTVQAKGEIAELADTINSMIDTLDTFSDQVTTVAREVGVEGRLGGQALVPGAAGSWRDLVDNVNLLAANLTTQVRAIAEVSTAVTTGDLTRTIQVEARGEVDELKNNLNEMIRNLRDTTLRNTEQDWLKTNLARMTRLLQGQRNISAVAQTVLSELAPLVHAPHGVFYVMGTADRAPRLELLASFGFQERRNLSNTWRLKQGLVGQCAFEKQRILLANVPSDYVRITSGLGEATPLNIAVIPILFEDQVKAVVELASFDRFTSIHLSLLDQLAEGLGVVLNSIESSLRTEELLKQSQALTGELKTQQEELQRSNQELEEKAQLLADQNREVGEKNREVQRAQRELERKAEQLAITSKYKSEFLANMSHELRTPLNSLLLLAQQLAEESSDLTPRQVQFAQTIYASGTDLLTLINDILDLSRVEAGRVEVEFEDVPIADVVAKAEATFRPVAENKGLAFNITVAPEVPRAIRTDGQRLSQILKNLLSNAFKFTEHGSVELAVRVAQTGWERRQPALDRAAKVVAFDVRDTGIGIAPDQQKIIFEAFQQAHVGTARKYGGAGLGLAISRELATLLGGAIEVESEPARGSTFTLYLATNGTPPPSRRPETPARPNGEPAVSMPAPRPHDAAAALVQDDRAAIRPGERVLLVIEDDPVFARQLVELGRATGFKAVWAGTGNEGLRRARELLPAAITLDMYMPDLDGWAVLDRLKADAITRAIPVEIISVEADRLHGLERGAFGYLVKPIERAAIEEALTGLTRFVEKPERRGLVVASDETVREALLEAIGGDDVEFVGALGVDAAMAELTARRVGCVVIDMRLGDTEVARMLIALRDLATLRDVPVVLYGTLARGPDSPVRTAAGDRVLRVVPTLDRVLFETALYLHRRSEEMPEARRRVLESVRYREAELAGKRVLVVDDDIRNVFALTSVLERHGMVVASAESGKAALAQLGEGGDVDLVLMDVMMPEMDGYEAMRAIREMPRYRKLPIIALTAKAMKEDREKCIAAGASDYLAKPVSNTKLLSALRLWAQAR